MVSKRGNNRGARNKSGQKCGGTNKIVAGRNSICRSNSNGNRSCSSNSRNNSRNSSSRSCINNGNSGNNSCNNATNTRSSNKSTTNNNRSSSSINSRGGRCGASNRSGGVTVCSDYIENDINSSIGKSDVMASVSCASGGDVFGRGESGLETRSIGIFSGGLFGRGTSGIGRCGRRASGVGVLDREEFGLGVSDAGVSGSGGLPCGGGGPGGRAGSRGGGTSSVGASECSDIYNLLLISGSFCSNGITVVKLPQYILNALTIFDSEANAIKNNQNNFNNFINITNKYTSFPYMYNAYDENNNNMRGNILEKCANLIKDSKNNNNNENKNFNDINFKYDYNRHVYDACKRGNKGFGFNYNNNVINNMNDNNTTNISNNNISNKHNINVNANNKTQKTSIKSYDSNNNSIMYNDDSDSDIYNILNLCTKEIIDASKISYIHRFLLNIDEFLPHFRHYCLMCFTSSDVRECMIWRHEDVLHNEKINIHDIIKCIDKARNKTLNTICTNNKYACICCAGIPYIAQHHYIQHINICNAFRILHKYLMQRFLYALLHAGLDELCVYIASNEPLMSGHAYIAENIFRQYANDINKYIEKIAHGSINISNNNCEDFCKNIQTDEKCKKNQNICTRKYQSNTSETHSVDIQQIASNMAHPAAGATTEAATSTASADNNTAIGMTANSGAGDGEGHILENAGAAHATGAATCGSPACCDSIGGRGGLGSTPDSWECNEDICVDKMRQIAHLTNCVADSLATRRVNTHKQPPLVSRLVYIQYHSLPLSAPSDWLSSSDILHQLTSPEEPSLEPLCMLLLPRRLKYQCQHDDSQKKPLAVSLNQGILVAAPLLSDVCALYRYTRGYTNTLSDMTKHSGKNNSAQFPKLPGVTSRALRAVRRVLKSIGPYMSDMSNHDGVYSSDFQADFTNNNSENVREERSGKSSVFGSYGENEAPPFRSDVWGSVYPNFSIRGLLVVCIKARRDMLLAAAAGAPNISFGLRYFVPHFTESILKSMMRRRQHGIYPYMSQNPRRHGNSDFQVEHHENPSVDIYTHNSSTGNDQHFSAMHPHRGSPVLPFGNCGLKYELSEHIGPACRPPCEACTWLWVHPMTDEKEKISATNNINSDANSSITIIDDPSCECIDNIPSTQGGKNTYRSCFYGGCCSRSNNTVDMNDTCGIYKHDIVNSSCGRKRRISESGEYDGEKTFGSVVEALSSSSQYRNDEKLPRINDVNIFTNKKRTVECFKGVKPSESSSKYIDITVNIRTEKTRMDTRASSKSVYSLSTNSCSNRTKNAKMHFINSEDKNDLIDNKIRNKLLVVKRENNNVINNDGKKVINQDEDNEASQYNRYSGGRQNMKANGIYLSNINGYKRPGLNNGFLLTASETHILGVWGASRCVLLGPKTHLYVCVTSSELNGNFSGISTGNFNSEHSGGQFSTQNNLTYGTNPVINNASRRSLRSSYTTGMYSNLGCRNISDGNSGETREADSDHSRNDVFDQSENNRLFSEVRNIRTNYDGNDLEGSGDTNIPVIASGYRNISSNTLSGRLIGSFSDVLRMGGGLRTVEASNRNSLLMTVSGDKYGSRVRVLVGFGSPFPVSCRLIGESATNFNSTALQQQRSCQRILRTVVANESQPPDGLALYQQLTHMWRQQTGDLFLQQDVSGLCECVYAVTKWGSHERMTDNFSACRLNQRNLDFGGVMPNEYMERSAITGVDRNLQMINDTRGNVVEQSVVDVGCVCAARRSDSPGPCNTQSNANINEHSFISSLQTASTRVESAVLRIRGVSRAHGSGRRRGRNRARASAFVRRSGRRECTDISGLFGNSEITYQNTDDIRSSVDSLRLSGDGINSAYDPVEISASPQSGNDVSPAYQTGLRSPQLGNDDSISIISRSEIATGNSQPHIENEIEGQRSLMRSQLDTPVNEMIQATRVNVSRGDRGPTASGRQADLNTLSNLGMRMWNGLYRPNSGSVWPDMASLNQFTSVLGDRSQFLFWSRNRDALNEWPRCMYSVEAFKPLFYKYYGYLTPLFLDMSYRNLYPECGIARRKNLCDNEDESNQSINLCNNDFRSNKRSRTDRFMGDGSIYGHGCELSEHNHRRDRVAEDEINEFSVNSMRPHGRNLCDTSACVAEYKNPNNYNNHNNSNINSSPNTKSSSSPSAEEGRSRQFANNRCCSDSSRSFRRLSRRSDISRRFNEMSLPKSPKLQVIATPDSPSPMAFPPSALQASISAVVASHESKAKTRLYNSTLACCSSSNRPQQKLVVPFTRALPKNKFKYQIRNKRQLLNASDEIKNINIQEGEKGFQMSEECSEEYNFKGDDLEFWPPCMEQGGGTMIVHFCRRYIQIPVIRHRRLVDFGYLDGVWSLDDNDYIHQSSGNGARDNSVDGIWRPGGLLNNLPISLVGVVLEFLTISEFFTFRLVCLHRN